ncbi:hypothetical protein KL922_004440, partial [Ogataea haglerorum]
MSATEPTKEKVPLHEDDEEEDDIDQLVMELQSNHGGEDGEEEDEEQDHSSFKVVPDELLRTDPKVGLTSDEVAK